MLVELAQRPVVANVVVAMAAIGEKRSRRWVMGGVRGRVRPIPALRQLMPNEPEAAADVGSCVGEASGHVSGEAQILAEVEA
jgi:hypothetical protein